MRREVVMERRLEGEVGESTVREELDPEEQPETVMIPHTFHVVYYYTEE